MSSYKLKVLLIGATGVNKTSLIKKINIKNRSPAGHKIATGVDILAKDVEFRQREFATLSIWDIGGQKRFEFIHSNFYKATAGVISVFDLTREETYSEVKKFLTEIRQIAGENIPFVLVGDNIHLLKLEVKPNIQKEAREFAKNEGGIYIETSPTSIDVIENAIQQLVLRIIEFSR